MSETPSSSNVRRTPQGITTSPELTTEAVSEWSTEDFLDAEPYPLPEPTDKAVQDFLDAVRSPSAAGGRTSPGGTPTGAEEDGQASPTAGHGRVPGDGVGGR